MLLSYRTTEFLAIILFFPFVSFVLGFFKEEGRIKEAVYKELMSLTSASLQGIWGGRELPLCKAERYWISKSDWLLFLLLSFHVFSEIFLSVMQSPQSGYAWVPYLVLLLSSTALLYILSRMCYSAFVLGLFFLYLGTVVLNLDAAWCPSLGAKYSEHWSAGLY